MSNQINYREKLKISVITPSFNQGKYIEETILSVINQGYSNLEYIIIDGGSTDNTIEIIKKYENKISYWVSEKDSGQSEAINKGFKIATGDILCWLNSDDIFLSNALNIVSSFFINNKEYQVVNGYLVIIDQFSNILDNLVTLRQKEWYARRGVYYVSQPSMFWRKEVLQKVGFLRNDFQASMDREFLIRIFQNNIRIGQIKKLLAGFRVHDTSKSAAGWENKDYIRDLAMIKEIHGNQYGGEPLLFYKLVYGLEKFLRGIYLKNWIFCFRWKGYPVEKISLSN
ncbi:glycosyltransferase family 2 protein [Segetibacter aerophilus]|uniref:Glycosyltransferase 2-like domain-containing protein n=1 Tax=Segetibacter aerophilus TaxID=670293 RepID=A0A512BH06_9BACT|nr:glycosyltransferase family 2 protein [Segetibacter aerophilus]GEO11239.1 hypothetical protein SAE01_37350 [Segetibacter aerophilus]